MRLQGQPSSQSRAENSTWLRGMISREKSRFPEPVELSNSANSQPSDQGVANHIDQAKGLFDRWMILLDSRTEVGMELMIHNPSVLIDQVLSSLRGSSSLNSVIWGLYHTTLSNSNTKSHIINLSHSLNQNNKTSHNLSQNNHNPNQNLNTSRSTNQNLNQNHHSQKNPLSKNQHSSNQTNLRRSNLGTQCHRSNQMKNRIK